MSSMRRILIILCSLITVFAVSWAVKAKTPINRPSNLEEELETPWYLNRYSSPVADDGWTLDPEIPLNYIPVPGEDELYMVVDDNGNITGYRHRTKQADGTWLWEDVNPDIPDNYVKVEGLENVYKCTNADGSVSYFKYIRNSDDTFAFVPVDENGKPLDDGKSADTVDDNYVHVDGNVYAVYDDNNVKMGYRKRVKQDDGSFIWKECDAPTAASSDGLSNIFGNSSNNNTASNSGIQSEGSNSGNNKVTNADGSYTVTETSTNTETKDGYTITYQTTVKKTYDSGGNLLSTKKDGPYEVSRIESGSSAKVDKSKIASTLDGELARVSASVEYNTDKAKEVLTKLNAQRKSQGLSSLSMSTDSEAYKLACIRAADMAIYDYSSSTSPMYGTIDEMVSRWGLTSSHASENIWKASAKSAADIHTRFQANSGSKKIRMSNGYSEVGIAIVEKNGQTYIAEIYLK